MTAKKTQSKAPLLKTQTGNKESNTTTFGTNALEGRTKVNANIDRVIAQSFNATDQESKRRLYEHLLREKPTGRGPAVGVAELARLVDERLRGRFGEELPSAENIAVEIESTLDLIMMCQCLLHARQRDWQSRLRALCEVDRTEAAEIELNDNEEKIKRVIFGKIFPLKFPLALFAMGVRSDEVKKRSARVAKFLVATIGKWDWSDAPRGALDLFSGFQDVVPRRFLHRMTPRMNPGLVYEEEIELENSPKAPISEKDAIDWIKKMEMWPDKESLWWVARKWLKWQATEEKKLQNSDKGKKSGEARRKKRDAGKAAG